MELRVRGGRPSFLVSIVPIVWCRVCYGLTAEMATGGMFSFRRPEDACMAIVASVCYQWRGWRRSSWDYGVSKACRYDQRSERPHLTMAES